MTQPTHPSVLVVSEVKAHEARMGLGDRPYASTTEFSPTGSLNGPHFDEIYRDHFAFVWRSARRLGVDASSLDDVVQEVFVIAHRRLPSFEGRSSVSTWLFGITLRVARDHRRSRARRPLDPHAEPDSLC
jgi:hypothetical protein